MPTLVEAEHYLKLPSGLATCVKITFTFLKYIQICITSVTNFDVVSLRVFKRGVG